MNWSKWLSLVIKRDSQDLSLCRPLLAEKRVVISPQHLNMYHQLIGHQSQQWVISYLQTIAFESYLELMARSDFPLAPIGMIHTANELEWLGDVAVEQPINLVSRIDDIAQSPKGPVVVIETEAWQNSRLIWRSVATNLKPMGQSTGKKTPPSMTPEDFSWQPSRRLPANIGRQYARLSGDINPIHLWPLTAKLFGFAAPIAHGMYTLACGASQLQQLQSTNLRKLTVQFRKPVLLPAEIELGYRDDNQQFVLTDPSQQKVYITGNYQCN